MTGAPAAPGSLGVAPAAQDMLAYLGALDAWLSQRRAELDALDAQILNTGRQGELTADMTLAMALWQAAKTRQNLLLTTWDSGRVGREELERLSGLIWGRLDTAGSPVSALQSMAVSLPEAGRLSDALIAQLRARLNTDPNATALQLRLTGLRAQAERIRDQLALEPPALAPAGRARLAEFVTRAQQLSDKQSRGGDIAGLLSALETETARFERDLIVGAARRREGRELLAAVRAEHAAAAAGEATATALVAEVSAAVWPVPQLSVPALASLGPVPNTAEALTGYRARLGQLSAATADVQAQFRARLAERDNAAAQLAGLQTKADALPPDATISDLIAQISALLAKPPVVLPTVQQLLGALAGQIGFRSQGVSR
ncbi:MAG TPA: hypothetical protein VK903_05520 [Propionicimonas sp.]|nr:hypothetical protein [Propionicimonas sp.]